MYTRVDLSFLAFVLFVLVFEERRAGVGCSGLRGTAPGVLPIFRRGEKIQGERVLAVRGSFFRRACGLSCVGEA